MRVALLGSGWSIYRGVSWPRTPDQECIGVLGQFQRAAALGALVVGYLRRVATTDKEKNCKMKLTFAVAAALSVLSASSARRISVVLG
jgi:hypothetical protein